MGRRNPYFGSSLADFLSAEGILEEATEHALKVVAELAPSPKPIADDGCPTLDIIECQFKDIFG